ncbi:MAG: hypothetical protein HKN03_17445 [Acidimicrobiales bacterium]|nr:hypothetical protein [Acidimicrobiales bacterium]
MAHTNSSDKRPVARHRPLVVLAALSVCAASLPAAAGAGMESDVKCTITGTDAADWIVGTSGPDVVCAGAGDDVVWGLGGDDVLYGQEGRDVLLGGDGEDRMVGGAGADVLDGAGGSDSFDTGEGVDVAFNDAADMALRADPGGVVSRSGVGAGGDRCEAAEREFKCESLNYISDGFTFASVEGWLDEELFAEAAAGVRSPKPVPVGREPLKGEIEMADRVRSMIGLASDPAELGELIRSHPRNPSLAMLGIPLTGQEWKQFLVQQSTLDRLSDFTDRAAAMEGFLTQRFGYQGNGVLTVWGTDPQRLADGLGPDLAESVIVKESTFSRADLARFSESALEVIGEESVVRIGLDQSNSIRVEVNEASAAGRSISDVNSVADQLRPLAPSGVPVIAIAGPAGVDQMDENCRQDGRCRVTQPVAHYGSQSTSMPGVPVRVQAVPQ